jgi:hypothetical protein
MEENNKKEIALIELSKKEIELILMCSDYYFKSVGVNLDSKVVLLRDKLYKEYKE